MPSYIYLKITTNQIAICKLSVLKYVDLLLHCLTVIEFVANLFTVRIQIVQLYISPVIKMFATLIGIKGSLMDKSRYHRRIVYCCIWIKVFF